MKLRSPTTTLLHRARIIFVATAVVPTVLMTGIGIVSLVAAGSKSVAVIGGILGLGFCATALVGYTVGTIFVTRGAALAQAVGNLLGNAWKYTPAAGKKIEVTARADLNHVVISVTDNGAGVPAPERELIFEKFQRGRAAVDTGSPGTGLGLAIVRAIVRAHKGEVDVRPAADHGASFRITLPRWRQAA